MGEARKRKYNVKHARRWSFTWPCINCERSKLFLVDELPDESPLARCARCSYIMRVGPQHREKEHHGRQATVDSDTALG